MVWVPDTRWAEELVEECAAFPHGDYDDLVDSTTQALLRYRQGGFIGLESDDDLQNNQPRMRKEYY
jgi:phage terminase large subunit-like protein